MVIVQIGSADPSGAEPHQDLAILRVRRLRAILNFELMGSVDDTSDHRGWGVRVLEGVSVSTGAKWLKDVLPSAQQCNPLAESRARQSSAWDFPLCWL